MDDIWQKKWPIATLRTELWAELHGYDSTANVSNAAAACRMLQHHASLSTAHYAIANIVSGMDGTLESTQLSLQSA